jgi:hypothetical protein
MTRIERELRGLQAKPRSGVKKEDHRERARSLQDDRYEFHVWQTEIEDKALIKKALKFGIYLDEIVFSENEDPNNVGRYHRIGDFGHELLRSEFREPLVKAIRERRPTYLKEQRERAEIYIKLIAALTGIIGTTTGLLAVLLR